MNKEDKKYEFECKNCQCHCKLTFVAAAAQIPKYCHYGIKNVNWQHRFEQPEEAVIEEEHRKQQRLHYR